MAGTKQWHKTAKGMDDIRINTNTRFITMAAQAFINEGNRGRNMLDFGRQFWFEKVPLRVVSENGTTSYMQMTKDDIDTQGRPLEFLIEVDPLFGNSDAQKQIALGILDRGVEYEKFRMSAKDPTMPKANIAEMFKNVLLKSGYRDTSRLFSMSSGEMSPDDELAVLAQGGTNVECRGNLMGHVTKHLLDLTSPELKKMVESGKAHPDTMKNLQLLIAQAMAKMKTFINDPQSAAAQKLNDLGLVHPGAAQ